MMIRPYRQDDHSGVVDLWTKTFDYPRAHNNPNLSIRLKTAVEDDLFFVAVDQHKGIVGTIMAGWDGHRGWLYSLAVAPEEQGNGIGRALVEHAVTVLRDLGCPKVNLQVMPNNLQAVGFYEKLGFRIEDRVSMGRTLY